MQSWLSKRIAVLSLAPAIILVCFIAYTLVISLEDLGHAKLTKTESGLARLSNNAIVQIQKERGMSAGFLGSEGTKFRSELSAQRQLVNDAISRIFDFKAINEIPDANTQLLPKLATFQSSLKLIRQNVDSLDISPSSSTAKYTEGTSLLLDYNGRLVATVKNSLGKQKFVLLYKLARLQESAGLERAFLNTLFSGDEVSVEQRLQAKNSVLTQQAYLNDIRVLSTQEFLNQLNVFVESSENKAVDSFRQQIQTGNLDAKPEVWFSIASARINALNSSIETLFLQLDTHASEDYSAAFFTVIFDVVLLIVIVVLASATYFVLNLRKRQSTELQTKLQKIHCEHDLTLVCEQISQDDLGNVTQLVNDLITRFRNDLSTFLDNANEIASASQQSASSSTMTSENVAKQQASISSSLLLAESVDIGIREDMKSITQLTEYAQMSSAKVKDGEKTVESAVQGIHSTAAEVQKVGKTIEELNTKVADILNMVDVIRSVADQTNLLALNAAIEAARAGEQGRGFAVVADEVRALAKRTQESTEEIAKVVDDLNESSTKAFDSIASGEQTASNAVLSADEINRALVEVSQNMRELENLALNADQSAQQQGSSLEMLTQNIRSVDEASAENALSSEQVASAAYQLSCVAETMLNNIQKYKVS